MKAKIWRDEKFVYSTDKNDWIKTEISSENRKISMKISQYQDIIVLDSKGLVSENLGKVLGQFYFEPESHFYKQSGSDGTYMFHMNSHGWFVGPDPGKPDGWLKNNSDSNSVPKSGWKCRIGDRWEEDPSCVITNGPILCDKLGIGLYNFRNRRNKERGQEQPWNPPIRSKRWFHIEQK